MSSIKVKIDLAKIKIYVDKINGILDDRYISDRAKRVVARDLINSGIRDFTTASVSVDNLFQEEE